MLEELADRRTRRPFCLSVRCNCDPGLNGLRCRKRPTQSEIERC